HPPQQAPVSVEESTDPAGRILGLAHRVLRVHEGSLAALTQVGTRAPRPAKPRYRRPWRARDDLFTTMSMRRYETRCGDSSPKRSGPTPTNGTKRAAFHESCTPKPVRSACSGWAFPRP